MVILDLCNSPSFQCWFLLYFSAVFLALVICVCVDTAGSYQLYFLVAYYDVSFSFVNSWERCKFLATESLSYLSYKFKCL